MYGVPSVLCLPYMFAADSTMIFSGETASVNVTITRKNLVTSLPVKVTVFRMDWV